MIGSLRYGSRIGSRLWIGFTDLVSNLQGKYRDSDDRLQKEKQTLIETPSTDHASYLCRHHKAGRDVLYVELD